MRLWHWISQALQGPGHLRFIIQPLIAILIGLREARVDARTGRPPFLLGLIRERRPWAQKLKAGMRAVLVPMVIAFVADCLFQLYTLHHVRPLWAAVVGVFLVALPYSIVRALGNRVISRWRRSTSGQPRHRWAR